MRDGWGEWKVLTQLFSVFADFCMLRVGEHILSIELNTREILLFYSLMSFLMQFQPPQLFWEQDFFIRVSLLNTDFCSHLPAVCDSHINSYIAFWPVLSC